MKQEKVVDKAVTLIFDFFTSEENSALLFGNYKPLSVHDIEYLLRYSIGDKENGSKVAISDRLKKYLDNLEIEKSKEVKDES